MSAVQYFYLKKRRLLRKSKITNNHGATYIYSTVPITKKKKRFII
jgi:hypothetical protein